MSWKTVGYWLEQQPFINEGVNDNVYSNRSCDYYRRLLFTGGGDHLQPGFEIPVKIVKLFRE